MKIKVFFSLSVLFFSLSPPNEHFIFPIPKTVIRLNLAEKPTPLANCGFFQAPSLTPKQLFAKLAVQ